LKALARTAAVILDNDAVGLGCGYLPGLGERDGRLAALEVPASTPRIVLGPPDATDAEVASAAAQTG